VLVVVALTLAALHPRPAPAATRPREQTALLRLFATDAALARARQDEQGARSRLASVRGELAAQRVLLAAARANEGASQRALALRLNEIYRARPLDAFAILLESRSWSDVSVGLDLLDRLSRSDSALVRSARAWQAALRRRTRTLERAQGRVEAVQGALQARVAVLQDADRAQRALLAQLRRERVHAVTALAATARRDVQRARRVVRPQPHGGGRTSTPLPAVTKPPSLSPDTALSVSATAYSLPGHTASGLPVGPGICATDPRVIPLGTRFEVPGYGPCVAADTGSAIIGARIDLWMPEERASVYGTQTITITFR
jgi:3D (Asp-Asp-Asp) domain-containing protein